ncbi:MAG: NACHT domain-containing protein [Nocardiopsaceae bacterium]|nr:NACHT domain-containing protein [Nocardiopsaceae bacterium]
MIDVSMDQAATEALVAAIGVAGRWLATAARAPRGRKAEDLGIARWFETYKLTSDVPELPELSPADAERLAEILRGPDVQATLQELLAARLTDAPDNDAARAREAFRLTVTLALPSAASSAARLADFYDEQIGTLVARVEAGEPDLLAQIRSEALSTRMIAVLNAIERHTAALSTSPRNADTFLASYRRQVVEQHGSLQPPDFERRRRVPIDDIYVPAAIYEEPSTERIVATADPPPSVSVWELAERADRSVLLGDPGGGKTTASNVLMHHFASDSSSRVPFLVTLRDFASEDPPSRSVVGHIEHLLETFYQRPAPPGLVDSLLLTGRAIVIFDGLDELLDTSRRAGVATRVERFCTEYPLAPVLVTSRVVGYDQARLDDRQFTCYRLGGFRDEDVADYARKWFALEPGAHPDEASAFLSESVSVPDLRSNPLLLSLMCILYRGEGSLPQNRAEIYEQCATLLFRKWDARRRIHQELRAGNLVEPTLRHLAWWLFTREDTQSAVTERELVNATTEFLHGRGFESSDEAREAAREFIEFCRGRMWVLTDTGTTATGEHLFSFTHRTFMEYFAAAQLAFDSDAPEKLAKTIAPHVARGEWEIVAELAVQIKDRTSRDGARRIYGHLLHEPRRRSRAGRSNILQFLARTLRSVDPTPEVARKSAREIINFMFAGDPNGPVSCLPLAWLLASSEAHLSVVDEEISEFITGMIGSDSPEDRITGLRFALTLDIPPAGDWEGRAPEISSYEKIRGTWAARRLHVIENYPRELISAAREYYDIRNIALFEDLLTVQDVLAMPGGLESLVQRCETPVYSHERGSCGTLYFIWAGPASLGFPPPLTPVGESALTDIGHYIAGHPHHPWATGKIDTWSNFPWKALEASQGARPALSEHAYLGGAAVALTTAEQNPRTPSEFLDGNPDKLGRFRDIYWYVESRKKGSPDPHELPPLPVPEEFKPVFRDWAAGKIDFVGPETEHN